MVGLPIIHGPLFEDRYHREGKWHQFSPQIKELFCSRAPRPCQRMVVDWILTFDFPWIKHIPKVTLAGYIKADQQKLWKYRFSLEYQMRDKNSFKSFEWGDAMEVIKSYPFYAPPACSCPLPCNIEKIDLLGLRNPEASWYFKQRSIPHLEAIMRNNFDAYDGYTPDVGRRVHRLFKFLKWTIKWKFLIFVGPKANIEAFEAEMEPEDASGEDENVD